MQQVVDLQNDPNFQALGVSVVSIAFDSIEEQAPEAASLGITSVPMLSDADHSVSQAYDVLKWAIASGETVTGVTTMLIDEGRFEDAIAVLNESLSVNPEHANTIYNLGYACYQLGRYEEAAAWFVANRYLKPDKG